MSPVETLDRDRLPAPRDVVRSGMCIGCGACVAGRDEARMRWDAYGQLKPAAPQSWLRERTAAFSRTCPFSPAAQDEDALAEGRFPFAAHRDPLIGRFEAAYVGHAAQADFRGTGSSGGMVSWAAAELLRRGLVDGVAHVVANARPRAGEPFFRYRVSRTEAAIREGAKSRYYPVELSGVLDEMRTVPGRYAIVGIPCFIKAVELMRLEHAWVRERIAFTLGLFCGHMKSARMVESFAWQLGVPTKAVERVDFRLKNPDRPANWYTAHLALEDGRSVQEDWWHLADGDWGAGFLQNSACDFCDDVVAETADISFGDAWVEPYSSDGRGTNVVIVRSPVLHDLVREAVADGQLCLDQVDAAFIERTQAAGLRHRREGLAYRLTWPRTGLQPRKRIAPGAAGLGLRRRLIYRMRYGIARWSHRVFRLARLLGLPGLYIGWARAALGLYHGLAYSRGRLGAILDRLLGSARPQAD